MSRHGSIEVKIHRPIVKSKAGVNSWGFSILEPIFGYEEGLESGASGVPGSMAQRLKCIFPILPSHRLQRLGQCLIHDVDPMLFAMNAWARAAALLNAFRSD